MKNLSDKDLYAECKKWGSAALKARWKFQGLLPEVYRRKLYAKQGYSCIYEFAARLAGMSRDQVDKVLRLEKRFYDKPVLKKALISGKISANKLVRIASIATKENQQEILQKTETLSKAALDIYVKETRNDLEHGKNEQKTLPGQSEMETKISTVNLDQDIQMKLSQLQQKGIDINSLLRKFLKQREENIEQEIKETTNQQSKTRYINVKTKQILTKKFGTKCAKPSCSNPSEHIHHEKPFAMYHIHDPNYLKPLCKGHHELVHSQDKYVQKFRQLTYI